jgi:long-subunit fatty acid transport protein
MKRNLLFVIALFVCTYSFAQSEIDALRLSGNDLQGTARGQAMGGAFGALGGDVTGVLINPAGLGVYRTSEVNASLNFASTHIKTNWKEDIQTQNKFKFNFDNISYVGYFPTGKENLKAVNFGFSYNRVKNFERRYAASGKNMDYSLTDYIANLTNSHNQGNGINSNDMEPFDDYGEYYMGNPWLSILGWQGALIYPSDPNSDPYTKYKGLLFPEETFDNQLTMAERGQIESYEFSLGTNFSDALYFGMTLSITDMMYRVDSYYEERFSQGGSFDLTNYLETQGSGCQIKLGAIWRPADFLRLGIAYHSPTWYSLTDYYYAKTRNTYDPKFSWAETPPDERFTYKLDTPYRLVFSAAGIIGTHAIVSVDYEIKDHSGMDLMDQYRNDKMYQSDNEFINKAFKTASTVRAGLEYRFTPQFSGRLGYSWVQNPYNALFKDDLRTVGTLPHYTVEGDVSYFTAGIGYRFTPQFYIDAALVYKTQTNDLYAFPFSYDEKRDESLSLVGASLKSSAYKGLLTLGYKF